MFVKVEYFGFYPLGADVELYNVQIMKAEWNTYNKAVFTYGKKNVVSPFLGQLYYVKYNEGFVFFVAVHGRMARASRQGQHKNQQAMKCIFP